MSLEFENAPYCKGENCTCLLTARADFDNGYCVMCWEEINTPKTLKEKQNAIFEELVKLGVK